MKYIAPLTEIEICEECAGMLCQSAQTTITDYPGGWSSEIEWGK